MAKGKPRREGRSRRISLAAERRENKLRRERALVRDAMRLRGLPPDRTIRMMMELSNFCIRLGRSRKHG
jgi:hypothetical protein